ncbi:DUF1449 domain-containing protein [Streptomonospora litoralis]|uniref:NfeD-like C-terminal domain-containing protein n=1 Tax=Streptomonospora litoralis TaxID=2498135 RepID=A0A4P6Q0L6_9ACTN|nr:DUF1449 domain-containing protein [Streptomonospora litoralis]QBI52077.1 hypothetical protein EKD16_01300 [Streptomonospora litoralis]
MAGLLEASLSFPTVLFSFLLLVVFGYWLFVVLGAVDTDILDADLDAGSSAGGIGGALGAVGLGGVPVTVVLSLLIAVSWFASLVGTVLIDPLSDSSPLTIAVALVVLVAAVIIAWGVTSAVVMGVRRLLPAERQRRGGDFVGQTCVVRTGRVDGEFGQAEISGGNGSWSLIEVRTIGGERLTAGSTALVFDYDADTGVYRVTPYDSALDPGTSA